MKRKAFVSFIVIYMLTACSSPVTQNTIPFPSVTPVVSTSIPETVSATLALTLPVESSPIAAAEADYFTQNGITLPAPGCSSITQPQMEGPYYKAGSPERNSLLEDGMDGTRLILAGYVVDQNCNPLPNVWLDFWQADASGEYDNVGYRLRGHQYTDSQGRYYLETILPGLYASRPIEHIHVKVQPEGGEVVTSQLYFPNQPVVGLTVNLEDRGGIQIGYFNFVIQM